MCIAILNIKNKLPQNYLENSFNNNNQGAGLLYVKNGKLETYKTYDIVDFIKQYYLVRKAIKTPIVLHFRIATSGFSEHNLHPFLVNKDLGFVHNGVIYGLGNKDYSDTYQFNEMLKKLPKNFLRNNTIKEFISNYIGSDKLVFLDSNNIWNIINEKNGHWHNGNWFSNNSYKQKNNYVWAGNKKVYKDTHVDDFINDELFNDVDSAYKIERLKDMFFCYSEKELLKCIEYHGFKSIDDAFDFYYY